MKTLSPAHARAGIGSASPLEHTVLRRWFASLGEACHGSDAGRTGTKASASTSEPSDCCPHPERCRFSGCQRHCRSPLPAA